MDLDAYDDPEPDTTTQLVADDRPAWRSVLDFPPAIAAVVAGVIALIAAVIADGNYAHDMDPVASAAGALAVGGGIVVVLAACLSLIWNPLARPLTSQAVLWAGIAALVLGAAAFAWSSAAQNDRLAEQAVGTTSPVNPSQPDPGTPPNSAPAPATPGPGTPAPKN